MLTEPIIKIIVKGDKLLTFNFNQKTEKVYNTILKMTNDSFLAGNVALKFEELKNKKIKAGIKQLFALAQEEPTYSILATIKSSNGQEYNITIYDSIDLVIAKYELASGKKFNKAEKENIKDRYENLLAKAVRNALLNQDKKKVKTKYGR